MPLFPSKFHRDLVLTQLRTLGATHVEVSFSGSGDSGSIDAAYCIDANGKRIELPDTTFSWPVTHSGFDGTQWYRKTKDQPMTLDKILEHLTNDALEEQGLDWYNNDGGQGRLTIDFTQSPPDIQLEVGINITQTEDHEFNFSDEYEDEDQNI